MQEFLWDVEVIFSDNDDQGDRKKKLTFSCYKRAIKCTWAEWGGRGTGQGGIEV